VSSKWGSRAKAVLARVGLSRCARCSDRCVRAYLDETAGARVGASIHMIRVGVAVCALLLVSQSLPLGQTVASAQAPVDAIAQQLDSTDARSVAWGACNAGVYLREDLIPRLARLLQFPPASDRIRERVLMAIVMDALIQLHARVPPVDLMSHVDRQPVQTLVLLSNATDHEDVLLALLPRVSGLTWFGVWICSDRSTCASSIGAATRMCRFRLRVDALRREREIAHSSISKTSTAAQIFRGCFTRLTQVGSNPGAGDAVERAGERPSAEKMTWLIIASVRYLHVAGHRYRGSQPSTARCTARRTGTPAPAAARTIPPAADPRRSRDTCRYGPSRRY
jgi:hypothetical protein